MPWKSGVLVHQTIDVHGRVEKHQLKRFTLRHEINNILQALSNIGLGSFSKYRSFDFRLLLFQNIVRTKIYKNIVFSVVLSKSFLSF